MALPKVDVTVHGLGKQATWHKSQAERLGPSKFPWWCSLRGLYSHISCSVSESKHWNPHCISLLHAPVLHLKNHWLDWFRSQQWGDSIAFAHLVYNRTQNIRLSTLYSAQTLRSINKWLHRRKLRFLEMLQTGLRHDQYDTNRWRFEAASGTSPRTLRRPCTSSATWSVPLPSASMASNLGRKMYSCYSRTTQESKCTLNRSAKAKPARFSASIFVQETTVLGLQVSPIGPWEPTAAAPFCWRQQVT